MTDQQSADSKPRPEHLSSDSDTSSTSSGNTATATRPRLRVAPPRVNHLPQWKVLLHNDDFNEVGYVVETNIEQIATNPLQALLQTLEADRNGLALLMTTHRERAELLAEQFMSKRLTVTIEPDR
jgi:ATP-dependent Clp protease adaptor protein ClpS